MRWGRVVREGRFFAAVTHGQRPEGSGGPKLANFQGQRVTATANAKPLRWSMLSGAEELQRSQCVRTEQVGEGDEEKVRRREEGKGWGQMVGSHQPWQDFDILLREH